MGGGVGGGGRRGEGLPVVVIVGLPSGSWTQAWYFEAAGVSSVGGATHVVLRRCGREQRVRGDLRAVVGLWSVTVAGQEQGSRGYSSWLAWGAGPGARAL